MFYLGKISALTAAICAMCAMHLSVAAEDVSPNSANNPTENAKKTTPEDFDGIAFLSDGNYKNSERTKTAIRSATGSLEAGMPALAQAIIEEFLSKSSPDENLREDLTAVYADALIAQGNFELAQKQISQIKEAANSPRNKIRKALIAIGLNRHDLADEFLEGIDPSEVGADDIVWYHLAKGYALFESSKLQDALKEFEAAKKSAKSQYALADAQIAINICKLSDDFKGAKLDEIEKDLSDKVRFYMGTPAGFQFAKQYAAVLFKLGKNDEAIEVINQQLGIQLAQDIDKDELRVIAAAMTKNRQKQSEMLQEILNTTSSAGVAEYALSLLAKSPDTQPQNFEEFLENIAKNGSPRICDRILLEIAKLRLKKGSAERAAETASKLLEDFPASRYRPDALRILAWAAFSQKGGKAPEYRLAATYLIALADMEKNADRKNDLMLLAADCYYLNKDFSTAAEIYTKLFETMRSERGVLLNRTVEVLLILDDIEAAKKIIDSSYKLDGISENDLWNAEWKLISKLREDGETKKALERIERAISDDSGVPGTVRLGMLWLRARLNDGETDSRKTISICDKVLKELPKIKFEDPTSAERIASNTMLMKARCYESLGENDIAYEIYKTLRSEYPESQAAQISYLYQARSEAAEMRYASAQKICQTLADLYPRGKYRYEAMSDAAHYSRMIGVDASYKAALSILDKLCSEYPEDPRNFYARMSQAEILRLINAFAEARSLYNEIINKFPDHPQIYIAWLGLGDSILAQPKRAADAAVIFERLFYLPEMPLDAKSEAAFKWSFALERAGREREANEIRWLTASQILSDKGAKAHPAACYWIARSLFALAKSLESEGQMRDARAAYELIVKNKLPSWQTAERKLKNTQI